MKKLLICLAAVCLMQSAGGCGLLPAHTYDGSESYYEAHPEQNNPPPYMRPQDQDNN